MTEFGTVQFGNTILRYQVQRSNRRSTSIQIDAQGITINAPVDAAAEQLQQLVYSRGAWIIQKQNYLEGLLDTPLPQRQFATGEEVRYLGRQYQLKRVDANQHIRLYGRFLEVPDLKATDVLYTKLVDWYRHRATERLPERVQLYSRRFGIQVPPIFIREQQKRWGSCNANGELRFNWRIIIAPMSLIDYVVAHELCHLQYLDHSAAFWRRLQQVMPDCLQRRDRLAQLGNSLNLGSPPKLSSCRSTSH